MESNNYPIVVPYDFTPISDVAIEHAAQLAKLCDKNVTLINIVDKSTQYFLRTNNLIGHLLSEKLQGICDEASQKYDVKFNYVLRKGRIISIRKLTEKLKASLMVIGIDKPKTSVSQVLRMIGTSPAPVYVVQSPIEWKPFKSIIFPVDKFEETRQKTGCCIKMAKTTNAQVKLFSIKKSDWGEQKSQEVIIRQIEKELIEKNVPFVLEFAKGKETEFADELLEFGKKNEADLFMLMKSPKVYFANTFFNKDDKKVMLNTHNIPTVYINSRDYGRYY